MPSRVARIAGMVVLLLSVTLVALSRARPDGAPSIEQLVDARTLEALAPLRERFDRHGDGLIVVVEVDRPETLREATSRAEAVLSALDGVTYTWSPQSRPRVVFEGPAAAPSVRWVRGSAIEPTGPPTALERLLAPTEHHAVILVETSESSSSLVEAHLLMERVHAGLARLPDRVTVIGGAVLRVASWRQVVSDLWWILPGLATVSALVPWLVFGSWAAVWFPMVVAASTCSLSIAAYAATTGSVSPLMVVLIPLWWSVATLDALHLYHRARVRADTTDPVRRAMEEIWWPCTATTSTTALALATVALSGDSELIAAFGWWGVFGTFAAFALTFVLGGSLRRVAPASPRTLRVTRGLARICTACGRRRGTVVLAWALLVLAALAAWPRLDVAVRYPDVFVPDHPVSRDIAYVRRWLGTDLLPIDLYLDPVADRYRDPRQSLLAVIRVADYLETFPETRAVVSAATWLREARSSATGRGIPIPALLGALESQATGAAAPAGLRAFVDPVEGGARLQLHLAPVTVERRAELLDWIAHFDATNLDGYRVVVGGPGALHQAVEDRSWRHLLGSGGWALVTLTACSLAILGARLWHWALVCNLIPLVVTGGIAATAGIPWSMGLMGLPILLAGLAIDDTIHILWSRRGGEGPPFDTTMSDCGPALLATSVLLGGGLGMLMLSGLRVHRELGLLALVGIALAFLCDITLLPALIPDRGRGSKRDD